MRLIVCGSRTLTDYSIVKTALDAVLKIVNKSELVVLSGHAKGADQLGEQWCFENMVKYERYPADWSKGKSAGMVRNALMVDNATHVLAFWDQKSSGTANTIELARKKKLKVKVIKFTRTTKNAAMGKVEPSWG